MRVSSQRDPKGNVYFAYASDNRSWMPPSMWLANLSIAVSRFGGLPQPAGAKFRDAPAPEADVPPVHPHEPEQVARIRGYKVESAGKTYRIYRGDLHRHTDISDDGVGDGSLMDLHRYALDAAALDFSIVGDHNMGSDKEYPLVADAEGQRPVHRSRIVSFRCTATSGACRIRTAIAT